MTLRPRYKLAILVAIVGAGVAFSWWFFGDDLGDPRRFAGRIVEITGALGPYAPAAFVGLQTIGPFLLLPAIPLTIAAGALFGPTWGTVWALTGNVLGAAVSFQAGRVLGHDFVEKRATGKLLTVKAGIEREGWRFVAFVRLVPIFPFGIINMMLGTTDISFRAYTLTTALCMAPGAAVFAWIGHTGAEAARGAEDTLRNLGIAGGLLLVLTGLPAAVRWARYRRNLERLKRKRAEEAEAAPRSEAPPGE